jgi:hypothetical protein
VLGDLDDLPPSASGWDRATACHNTVVVDGLNQRESATNASDLAPGANVLFFAADPDFQAVTLDDRHAYPRSTSRYRHTVAVSGGKTARYAVSVFEVDGGLQHDQIFHAAPGLNGRWQLSLPTGPPPATLLPPSLAYVPMARAEDGRWFVQAYGEFRLLGQAEALKPTTASLTPDGGAGQGVRLHLLGDGPLTLWTAASTEPGRSPANALGQGRAALIVRRRSLQGAPLRSVLVTVLEPTGSGPGLRRVGRMQSPPGTVVIYVETDDGPEHLVFNLVPGESKTVPLADGSSLTTDGPVVRVSRAGLTLAGGTFAETTGRRVEQALVTGRITHAARESSGPSRGWFDTNVSLNEPARLAGRVLLVQHGDGTTHGWTVDHVESHAGGARIHVVEEPGFLIDDTTSEARYYQFPRTFVRGPHEFWLLQIAR